jgi:transcriptional regulator with XRE-family HTH domain
MLIDHISTTAPVDVVCEELRTIFARKGISHGDVARRMGRSASYVSTRLHGHAQFTEHDLRVIAEVLDVPEPWFTYPGHTLRRLQQRPPVPHKSLKVLLRMNDWRRVRNTGHFQVWEHSQCDPVIALPISEQLLSPTVAWWAIDVVTGVKLTPKYRFPVQRLWEVQIRREGNVWSICVPYMRAYTQTSDLSRVREVSTEFVAGISRKPIDDVRVDVTVYLPHNMREDWDTYQAHVVQGNSDEANRFALRITEHMVTEGFTLDDIRILLAMADQQNSVD